MTEISVMRSEVGADEALSLIRRHAGDRELAIERRLYYPFYHCVAEGRLRWLFGERRMAVNCLVDARTGRTSSADDLDIEQESVPADEPLAPEAEASHAREQARRYASHALSRGYRVLGNFNLAVGEASLVHRPFWVIRSADWRMLVDAVTGEMHPLASQT